MARLAKLTLSSPENFLHTDKAEILKAIPHIQCIKINEGIYFAVQESDFLLLRQNTDFGITDLFISNLEKVNNADEVGLGELATYDQLRTLRLVWSHDANSYSSNGLSGSDDRPNNVYLNLSKKFSRADDSSVLQRLHPHPNLSTLQIEGYRDATFCGWMSDPNLYLPNLVKIELMGMPRCARLPSLGQLANLEELHISDMPNIREVDTSFYGGRDPFRKLRELCINKMENLEVLSTNLELSAGEMSWDDDEQKVQGDEIFPRLAHLVVTGCPRLIHGSAFQGYIGRIVASCSEVELSPGILVGSSHLFRLEVEPNIFGFSHASEFLQYSTDLRNLTIKSDSDLITLPEIIRSCHSLRSLQILDSCNFAALPDWLGDLASLEELEVHSAKLQRLPHSIKNVTSLKTLTLKKCNYKLRECCSRLGEDYDKIKHIKHVDAHEGTSFAIDSSNDMAILQKTTSHQLIELNIEHLEYLSSSEANIIELAQKEELQFLSLEWSELQFSLEWFNPVSNKVALEELQPHQNLKRLCIKNYVGGDYPNWLRLLPNLVRLELFNVQSGHLHLDYLQSLEDLYISSVSVFEVMKYRPEVLDLYAKSSICILSTQPVKNLRRVTIVRVGKLLWETSTSHCIEQKDDKNIFQREQEGRHSDTGRESSYQRTLFPRLQYLEIDCCLNVRFEPSIPWSARYIISGIKQYPFLFNWPSFYQVMGLSTSALSSKMEIKYFENIYSDSDSLQLLDIEELTVDSCIDPVPLPQCILGWKSLRKLEILNCRGIDGLPDWLGDMASLRELKVETYWMKTLPPCIERLTSLHTLTLSQCTKRLKQRCSESGDDWSKIKHIENVQVELRP
nr:disease resistance protein RGA2-like [Setaria viridis]